MATAPAIIQAGWDRITVASKSNEGIVGNALHSFGYHLSPNDLYSLGKGDDYSLVDSPRDVSGAKLHPDQASALDSNYSPSDMILVTNRLLSAARARDPRLSGVREFCGTTDGVRTHPYDLLYHQDGPLDSWDPSHLWHVHISFYRDVTAAEVLSAIDVVNGTPAQPPITKDWFDMATKADLVGVVYRVVLAGYTGQGNAMVTNAMAKSLSDARKKAEQVGKFVRFTGFGRKNNESAVYAVEDGQLRYLDKTNYNDIGSPYVTPLKPGADEWNFPAKAGSKDYRGK